LAAVMASGIVEGAFSFVGFLPARQQARLAALQSYQSLRHPLVVYESPHRIAAMLADAVTVLGDRVCVIGRELTKLHEEIMRTTLMEAEEHFRASRPRGEYVLVIAGAAGDAEPVDEEAANAMLRDLLASGV